MYVFPHLSAFLISCNHSIKCLIYFTKNVSNQRSILSVHGSRTEKTKREEREEAILPGLAVEGVKTVWPFLNFFVFF
jgi:hypothetical protein